MHELAFRQVHADLHYSPQLEIIGSGFDKKEWQETLKKAKVESATLFATCHHGWCYYNTKAGERSSSLKFDLLRAEMEAWSECPQLAGPHSDRGWERHTYRASETDPRRHFQEGLKKGMRFEIHPDWENAIMDVMTIKNKEL